MYISFIQITYRPDISNRIAQLQLQHSAMSAVIAQITTTLANKMLRTHFTNDSHETISHKAMRHTQGDQIFH
jgi:hypothetical protein